MTLEQAVNVFFDPLFRLVDAGHNDEALDAIIGFDAQRRLSESFRPASLLPMKGKTMSISNTLKTR